MAPSWPLAPLEKAFRLPRVVVAALSMDSSAASSYVLTPATKMPWCPSSEDRGAASGARVRQIIRANQPHTREASGVRRNSMRLCALDVQNRAVEAVAETSGDGDRLPRRDVHKSIERGLKSRQLAICATGQQELLAVGQHQGGGLRLAAGIQEDSPSQRLDGRGGCSRDESPWRGSSPRGCFAWRGFLRRRGFGLCLGSLFVRAWRRRFRHATRFGIRRFSCFSGHRRVLSFAPVREVKPNPRSISYSLAACKNNA